MRCVLIRDRWNLICQSALTNIYNVIRSVLEMILHSVDSSRIQFASTTDYCNISVHPVEEKFGNSAVLRGSRSKNKSWKNIEKDNS